MGPKDHREKVRRRIVAQRLREFLAHLLARLSGGSTELVDRAEKRNAPLGEPAAGSTDKR
jgi:hypothetical protein